LCWFLQASEVQNHLVDIQPDFKGNLLRGVEQYKIDVDEFVTDYAEKYV